jgi:hypothetical protein
MPRRPRKALQTPYYKRLQRELTKGRWKQLYREIRVRRKKELLKQREREFARLDRTLNLDIVTRRAFEKRLARLKQGAIDRRAFDALVYIDVVTAITRILPIPPSKKKVVRRLLLKSYRIMEETTRISVPKMPSKQAMNKIIKDARLISSKYADTFPKRYQPKVKKDLERAYAEMQLILDIVDGVRRENRELTHQERRFMYERLVDYDALIWRYIGKLIGENYRQYLMQKLDDYFMEKQMLDAEYLS